MYNDIIVPLDGSKLAEAALPHAKALAECFGGRLTLFSVVESVGIFSQPGVIGPVVTVELNVGEEKDKLSDYLQKIAEELRAEGIDVRKAVREGDPASQICDYAEEITADLIVMCSHGRSGIKRWVYGSVADRILRNAKAPVLLIRANPEAQS